MNEIKQVTFVLLSMKNKKGHAHRVVRPGQERLGAEFSRKGRLRRNMGKDMRGIFCHFDANPDLVAVRHRKGLAF